MAGWSMPEMSPWKPPSLTFPPNSARMWIRFAVWLIVGFFVYFLYSYKHSKLHIREEAAEA